ncbi:MAG TPA: DUF6174 domain-containing protein [Nocardioides sp.]|nr:DUF6174 domain-containing protein [Nocardioides sp.]
MRPFALSAAALLLPLALTACGSDDGHVASDPAPTSATSTPTPTPTASPTVGSYPEFAPTDYSYTLGVGCFCVGAGAPITVTVADGQVVKAVYAQDDTGRGGTSAGDPAEQRYWMTINDVIAQANDTTADQVTVDWPAGQEWPNQVSVDQHRDMADDEIYYTISDVQVTG